VRLTLEEGGTVSVPCKTRLPPTPGYVRFTR
jgi:hypothetical protein